MTARCYACHEELPVEMLARDAKKASGHVSICKPCDREKSRRYYRETEKRSWPR
jgi:hypothetical protein